MLFLVVIRQQGHLKETLGDLNLSYVRKTKPTDWGKW